MSSTMDIVEKGMMKRKIPEFRSGDKVRVYTRVKEGDRERIQAFEGVVIAKRNARNRSTFTVRKISYGVGVERIFPLYSPSIEKIEVLQKGKVRKSKLYYLRDLKGKAARLEYERAGIPIAEEGETPAVSTEGEGAEGEGELKD